MTDVRFIQIHTLHGYPAALLNRDDSGLAKRIPYGGAVRTRISSQCLKRHWRVADDAHAIHAVPGAEKAVRSRNIVDREVVAALRKDGTPDDVTDAIGEVFNEGVYGDKGGEESGRQPLLLGEPEIRHLLERARVIVAEHGDDAAAVRKAAEALFPKERANWRAFRDQTRLPGGIEGALFGRMVTSDPGANIDAAIHVSHALTVHREESEMDYFSVVDDLRTADEDAGAAHIGDTELTAGLFYGYVVVDVPELVSNVAGDRELAAKVVANLLHLIATVSPGAKLGSTAPYAYADTMLVEIGGRQPRSLAAAFRDPVAPSVDVAASALADQLARYDGAYGPHEARRAMATVPQEFSDAESSALPDIAGWVESAIAGGGA